MPVLNNFSKRQKLFVVFLSALLLVLFVRNIGHRGGLKVELFIVPKAARVSIDGKEVKGSSVRLPAGDHIFVVSHPDFETITKTENITGPQRVAIALTPKTANGQEIAQKEQSRYLQAEGFAGQEAVQEGESFTQRNPLVSQLPHRSLYFNIDYRATEADRAIIQITADTPIGRQFAIDQIRDWGHDPTDYEIEFIGFVNPFSGGQP